MGQRAVLISVECKIVFTSCPSKREPQTGGGLCPNLQNYRWEYGNIKNLGSFRNSETLGINMEKTLIGFSSLKNTS